MKLVLKYWQIFVSIAGILVFGCIIAFAVVNSVTQTNLFWSNQQTQLAQITEQRKQQIEGWILNKTQYLETLTGEVNRGMFQTVEEYEDQLRYYVGLDDYIQASFVGFEDETLYVSMPLDDPASSPTSRRWYHQGLEAGGEISYTEPYIDFLTDELVFTISKATTVQGMTCVVGIDISLVALTETIGELSVSENGGAFLSSEEGKIFACDDDELLPLIVDGEVQFVEVSEVVALTQILEETHSLMNMEVNIQRVIDYDGIEKYESYAIVPSTHWTLGVNIPLSDYDEAIGDLLSAQIPFMILTAIMLLLFLGLAGITISRERSLRAEQGLLMVKLNEKNEKLSIAADRDPLTGIYNRRYLTEYLEKRLDAYCKQKPVSLLMFDLDLFKVVNDTYGHLVGDEVLKAVAREVGTQLRSEDLLARFGGEEFVVILEGIGIEQAEMVAERIRIRVQHTVINGEISITISIGVVEAREGEPLSALLDRADVCMYSAKNAGRNTVVSDRD